MISTTEAYQIILNTTTLQSTEMVNLLDAVGRVLREEIHADRDFPPFHRVMMDGIAIRHQDFESGQREFVVDGIQAAGEVQKTLKKRHCLEVMTGAVLPAGADTVVPYEKVKITGGKAKVNQTEINKGQHVHMKGTDGKAEDLLISKGVVLGSAEIAVLATVGKARVKVSALPSVAIVSTGDELVEVWQNPEEHQIRKSNIYALASALTSWGVSPQTFHFADDSNTIRATLSQILNDFGVVLLSGGVSKGKFDYLPQVLEGLGVKKLFHRVAQRPGKPFWFGQYDQTTIFAFPGNPVSTFMCYYRYFVPWLTKSLGLQPLRIKYAILTEDFEFEPALTYFLQVKLALNSRGQLMATPLAGKGSGDLVNLVAADGFLELNERKSTFHRDEVYPVWVFRRLHFEA